jgi:hypothetical protein
MYDGDPMKKNFLVSRIHLRKSTIINHDIKEAQIHIHTNQNSSAFFSYLHHKL